MGARNLVRGAGLAGLAAIGLLALPSSPALAAYSHTTVEGTFPVGAPCARVIDIAVAESEGFVYASCAVNSGADVIKRFHLDGTPAPFSFSAPYISGNTLTENPGSENGTFVNSPRLAVDNSPSSNHGKLFVTSAPDVNFFLPSGKFGGAIKQPVETSIPNSIEGVDVGPDGSIYVTSPLPGDRVSKYTPAFQEVERMYLGEGNFFGGQADQIRVDSTGALWTRSGSPPEIKKWEQNQFTTELTPAFGFPAEKLAPFIAKPSPVVPIPLFTGEPVGRFDVDLGTDDVYVDQGEQIQTFSPGKPEELSYPDSPAFGFGVLSESEAIAVTEDNHVYASTAGPEIVRFGPGNILPDPHTFAPEINNVGHTEALVKGHIELAGGSNIVKCQVEYGTSTSYELPPAPCDPNPAENPPSSHFTADQDVSATLSGLTTGTTYHYRLMAENEQGANFGIDRTVVPAFVLKVQTLPATELQVDGGKLNASFDPDGAETTYFFEYGLNTGYGFQTPEVSAGHGSGVIDVQAGLSGLPSGKVFHYRVVATNASGTTRGEDLTFRTASPPDVSGAEATNITVKSALLHATVNPVGYDTTYEFEYGTTPEYGSSIPIPAADLGSGTSGVQIEQLISNLVPNVTYHFRVVATNKWGSSSSPDTTFDYSPPGCPNDHARQQTGASYLPDCRAYELVSPGGAGAAILVPSKFAADKAGQGPYHHEAQYLNNQGFASSPSRFAFYSAISTINGIDGPIGPATQYVATRTVNGWKTALPGLQGSEAYETGRKECSESMDRCIDHSESLFAGYHDEYAPYMFNAEGKFVGRLPTNLSIIPHGTEFRGAQRMSGDFNHFIFGSSEGQGVFGEEIKGVAFAPGAVTIGLGSAYDNDIDARTVTIISKLADGNNIPLEGPKSPGEKAIDFPGLSPDGSHVLMETPSTEGLKHLFMRVNDSVTYDVSGGFGVTPIGMTRDGSKVFFTSPSQVEPSEDHDSSVDLYMWQQSKEGGPPGYTLLSKGNGKGNESGCSTEWGPSECGVLPLQPERAHPAENTAVSVPGQDDLFAETNGAIYFYSPELLDGEKPGIKNQRNLYIYRNGTVHLVATFDPGTQVERMQISPDGAHAAFVTKSQILSYQNDGFAEMYTYDAETGIIRCASCNPSGAPPTSSVLASQGGRFMADDGRAFFSTHEALVPRDQDGKIIDTYEYVGGRPQLLTSGQGSVDHTGGEILSLFLPPEDIGLEAVSHNGTDVFFSTFETLLGEDHNGATVKFYDARTGGGFDQPGEPAPCAAADECHNAGSAPPPAPVISTGVNRGSSGNDKAARRKKQKAQKAKKHRKAAKHKKGKKAKGRER